MYISWLTLDIYKNDRRNRHAAFRAVLRSKAVKDAKKKGLKTAIIL